MKKRQNKFCLGVWNADTESSVEGYVSAFMANRWQSRLEQKRPKFSGYKPSKQWLNNWSRIEKLTEDLKDVRLTRQFEIATFFRTLQERADRVQEILFTMDKNLNPQNTSVYWIMHFANIAWDLNVLKGIIFDGSYPYECVGQKSDLVQFTYGHIKFRDFLRVSGFGSVRMAGLVCMSAKKLEGSEVYKLKKKDIPDRYEQYPQRIRDYMDNDVKVMDESLNIIVNRKENRTIQFLEDLPMTSTSFGRWRLAHNPEIIMENGKPVNVTGTLTYVRWKWARPHILYLMRAYKGGYCGPNPNIQYKILKNIICYDAVSMYPDKMLFHEMMQCTKYTEVRECPYTLEECIEHEREIYECQSALFRIRNIYDYINTFDDAGLMTKRADDHTEGLCPWIGTVTLTIFGVRKNGDDCHMMPFLSKHKVENLPKKGKPLENTARNVMTVNGKIIQGENIKVILTSMDLMLTILCYDCEVLQLHKWLTMSWREMLPVQKRDLWEAYKRKMHISKVLKRDRYTNDEYWRDECGFPPELINGMSDEEYKIFSKAYKGTIKTDPNGKYGMTVEKPVHPKTVIETSEEGFPIIKTESMAEMTERLLSDPIAATPEYVKASDYCAGSSITMWARWQLIMMMWVFFQNGIQVAYCDTDSLFVEKTEESARCVEIFNKRKKELYYTSNLGNDIMVNVDDAEGLGQFEVDKECDLFRTLGAKNYGYIRNGKIKLTVAGLRTQDYERFIQEEIDGGKDALCVFRERYRANTCIHPDACHKLLMNKDGCGFDENGEWIGPILEEVGFYLCDSDSHFHIMNMINCAKIQGKAVDYYIGLFGERLDVTGKGFKRLSRIKEDELIESYNTTEDRQPIKGGMV